MSLPASARGERYHPVRIVREDLPERFVARSIDEPAIDDEDEVGFLMVEPAELTSAGAPEHYPESFTEPAADGSLRLRDSRRKRAPRRLAVKKSGALGEGGDGAVAAWYMPGQFSLCLACLDTPSPQGRDKNRLSGLSAEGRSSATTTLATDLLVEMIRPERGVAEDKRKLLAFTDNRRDASLRAGHFNDTIFVAKPRAGVLAALPAGQTAK